MYPNRDKFQSPKSRCRSFDNSNRVGEGTLVHYGLVLWALQGIILIMDENILSALQELTGDCGRVAQPWAQRLRRVPRIEDLGFRSLAARR